MPRPTTKIELVEQAQSNFEKLWKLIDSMPECALNTEFDFSNEPKKKEAHWARDKNLRDILTHLYEWHQLLLNWVKSNMAGDEADFLPAPYNWKTYGEMNVALWKKHQTTSLEEATELIKASHASVVELVQSFTDDELFVKKYFSWTGTTSLGSYCVSAMPSHYDWAIKKLRAHLNKVTSK